MDEIKKALEDIFGATFSNEFSTEQFKHVYSLEHFDGRMNWGVSFDTQTGYIWITADLRDGRNHVLESHGYYDAVKVVKLLLWPFDRPDLPIEKDNRAWAVYLFPRGGDSRWESAYICRHSDGTIEFETYMGKAPNPPEEIPA